MKESKPELFKLHSVDDMTSFYCWKLVCEKPLTPRFLQVLLIQLTFPIPGAGDIVPPVFTVWKNGIHIKNNDTTESIIEVTNPPCQLIFSLRCKNERESCLLKRRSQLIHHILAILAKTSSLIGKNEFLYEHQTPFLIDAGAKTTSLKNADGNAFKENPKHIEFLYEPQPSYPISSCARKISLKNVAGAILEESSTVTFDDTVGIELTTLIQEDPVLILNIKTLKRIFWHPNDVIPQSIVAKYQKSLRPIIEKDLPSHLTYKELQDHVLQYSIFWNRNIWTLAGSKLEPLPLFKMKYNFKADKKLGLHVKKTCPFTVSIEEGQNLFIPFSSFSDEDYCYGHELVKLEGTSEHHVLDHELVFHNVKRDDSGIYELHPKHNGWTGTLQIIVDVEYSPDYNFIKENSSVITVAKGSTKEIIFAVKSNPPLSDETNHELICLRGREKVPATRRFEVINNTIILNNVAPEDAGIYQISSMNDCGLTGMKIFELNVLFAPEYNFTHESSSTFSVIKGVTKKITFKVLSNPPLTNDSKHEISSINNGIETATRFTVSDNTIVINDVEPKDSGLYQISCKNEGGQMGKKTFELNILFAPEYSFIEETEALIQVLEGSKKEIKFTVAANPPVSSITKHELTCLTGGVEVPATRRFIVSDNAIILKDIIPNDAGIYQISCKNGSGVIGKEVFELKVLCVPKYNLSATSIEVHEGSSQELIFSVSSKSPLSSNAQHVITALRDDDTTHDLTSEIFKVSQDVVSIMNARCEDSGTYQISCENVDGIVGKAIFNVNVTMAPVYEFVNEDSSLISVPEGSTREVKFTITSDIPLPENTKHELTRLTGGVEVPVTKRFMVINYTIILNDISLEDTGLYQISFKSRNGQIVKEVFELKVLCKPKYILNQSDLEILEGSTHEIAFSVTCDSLLHSDYRHEIFLLKEDNTQVPSPETITIRHNTIIFSKMRCEDSGTYQISCTTADGITGKEIFNLCVSKDTQKCQEFEEYLNKVPVSLQCRMDDIITNEGHLLRIAKKMIGWDKAFNLFGLDFNPDVHDIQYRHRDDSLMQRICALTLWRERSSCPTYKELLRICVKGEFLDSASEIIAIINESTLEEI